MRVALVHDWLTGMRGGERVLDELANLYPQADLYTLFHAPGRTSAAIEGLRIHASPLNRVPGSARHYRKLLPLFPWAIRRFWLEGYDLVLSTSHAVAKSVPVAPGTPHLCYCFTPMRYVWDQADAYLGHGLRRGLARPLVGALRRFDREHSGPDSVTRFVAISRCVAARIERHYGRGASVVFPPVDTQRIRPSGRAPEDFYLMVAGFVPYKREDLALEAFRRLGRRLVVVGDGPLRRRLAARAAANISFTGRIPDAELFDLYARCRALVHPQDEDFGLTALEAQAAGRPVIAFGSGGALDTLRPLQGPASRSQEPAPTGIHFRPQTAEALLHAVLHYEANAARFDAGQIRAWAEGFGRERFQRELQREIEAARAEQRGCAKRPHPDREVAFPPYRSLSRS